MTVAALKKPSPKTQLESFLAKYSPQTAKTARTVVAAMRKRLPGAILLVYDNYNALAIGFGTGERVSDVWFSIAVYPRWVSLFFFGTLPLKDPQKLLKGNGKTTRHIILTDGAATLGQPGVHALIEQALQKAGQPFKAGRGRLVIKSISAKQRLRRLS
jgi:hypothetical protein